MTRRRKRRPVRYDDEGRPIVTAKAHYARDCARCGETIEPGDEFTWRLGNRRAAVHIGCDDDKGEC